MMLVVDHVGRCLRLVYLEGEVMLHGQVSAVRAPTTSALRVASWMLLTVE